MYWDPLYFLVIAMFFIAMVAQNKVKRTYSKFSQVASERGITAERAVQMVLDYYGITDVSIQQIPGELTDNYNPKTNIISLSEPVAGSTSIAAIGVACHEAGHAAQHATGYLPIKIRNSIVPICNIGSRLGIPLAIIGIILQTSVSGMWETGQALIYAGIIMYGFAFLFQFVTLPTELDASHRALKVIDERDILSKDEREGAKKVLTAAAMTYVVALATALVNLLRFAYIFLGRGRRR
ncbi:MAG: zinc metallopeptidase [Clostridia bacterium]|nr:zinc metallopeptidase [Clostridia bacterium]